MELPQARAIGAEGRKTTLDFLSLCSPAQQDPTPPPNPGGYIKTHEFLQPLEQVGKKVVTKEENNAGVGVVEKHVSPSVTHVLPGGIGSYSISFYDQRAPKPEGSLFTVPQASSTERNGENSNCSSYTTGSGFTLWDESASNKGKTGKENIADDRHVRGEPSVNMGGGHWKTSTEQHSPSSSIHKLNSAVLSSISSSQPPSSAQKNQSFMNMITSSKIARKDAEEEEELVFVVKKEPSSHPKGDLSVKVEGRNADQKPNTPRSKHSATEQRRRCKINDRFQRLREIIPHGDQKRDKASFLLEVVEYIQYLQEKVQRYEGWNHEPSRMMPWGSCYRAGEGFIDQSQCTTSGSSQALVFAPKIDESNVGIPQSMPTNRQQLVDLRASSVPASEEPSGQQSCPPPLHRTVFPLGGASTSAPRDAMNTNKLTSDHQSQFWESKSRTTDATVVASDQKPKDSEQTIENGEIRISSAYSEGLLNSLTQALQNSGVDLSRASISVQIDLGKRVKSGLHSSTSAPKDGGIPMKNQSTSRPLTRTTGGESDQPLKKQRRIAEAS